MAEKTGNQTKTEPSTELFEDLEKIKALCGGMPPELTFRGSRRIVMERVWRRAESAEKAGQPLTPDNFSTLLTEEWARIKAAIPKLKAAYNTCCQMAAHEGSKQKLTKDQVEKRVEYFFEVKKRELLNDLGVQE